MSAGSRVRTKDSKCPIRRRRARTLKQSSLRAQNCRSNPGYTSARVADIAKLAGVSRATVYNNFEDKQAILNQLVRDYMSGYQEIGLRMQKAAKPSDTVFELLGTMLHETFMWRIQNADLRPAIEVAEQLPGSAWTEANHAADLAIHGWIATIHHASADHGVILPDIDIDFATEALLFHDRRHYFYARCEHQPS